MKGFVLAAGFGERLRPFTETVPKPLLPIGCVPLIGYALRLLAHHDVSDVIVNMHHLSESMQAVLGDGSPFGVRVQCSIEKDILGTGGGLKRVQAALADQTCVVINSDTPVFVDLHHMRDVHQRRGALATMVLREVADDDPVGRVDIDAEGRVLRILGQGMPGTAARSLMFAGVHILEPRVLDRLPAEQKTCILRQGYIPALQQGEPIFSVIGSGYWADAGTPETFFQTNMDALENRIAFAHVHPLHGYGAFGCTQSADGIWMGTHVDVGDDVEIIPPVVIGHHARIEAHAVVGPYAVLGAHVHVKRGATVRDCVVLDGTSIAAEKSYVGSIVGTRALLPVVDSLT